MPLNKLENFIKNTEGRILYVNPNDLDATDGIENQGNSLTKPFKTIQRALIESARFSYLRGSDNDITEKTTILLFPGEHLIDNRPGYAIKSVNNVATTVSPSGAESFAGNELTLTLNSNFDLTQPENILYKFNSIKGGIIVPRGTSIVGLDLRKTKIRPKYVPNPTDSNVDSSAIFRITGACYFWQFSIFDGNDTGLVYTDPVDFSELNQSKPTFSHHKLTCFEYADGVNLPAGYDLTDLDMYYSKVGNAFNRASGREVDQKYPAQAGAFAKQRPEWEIVGAFASDPVTITSIISGDGATPGSVITVTTEKAHGLTAGTPIKIRGINVADYNISTKVVQVISDNVFTYSLSSVRANLPAGPAAGLAPGSTASVTIETDTVSGASPYIFNISLRSVFGMQGMHADGSKADGFRSMVVAQFTAVSLQKDDRAFVKYNPSNRTYDSISVTRVAGEALSSGSSSTNEAFVYHLDSDAVYRNGWKTTHIKMSNDSVIQIVSVFAIGFHKHFEAQSGGDASITNSNSNFGQFSLAADGFKKDAFDKDNKGYVTSIVTPRSISGEETPIEWVQFDVDKTKAVNKNTHLYLLGYTNEDIPPPVISQGYRIGARVAERIYLDDDSYFGEVLMTNGPITSGNPTIQGFETSVKQYNDVVLFNDPNKGTIYVLGANHTLKNGESIRIFSETGDLPEGLEENTVYYAITNEKKTTLAVNEIQIASSRTNAEAQIPIFITSYGGVELRVESRVSDKEAGELGSPIQWDPNQNQWMIHIKGSGNPSSLWTYINTITTPESEISYFKRKEDERSLDEKLYKLRYVVPKELINGRDPVSGFILQDSSSTNVRAVSDFTLNTLTTDDYDFNRNPRFISSCTFDSGSSTITIRAEKNHDLKVGDKIIVENVRSTTNPFADEKTGYNGTFLVETVTDDKTFALDSTDVFGTTHAPGNITNNLNVRDIELPRFTRSDVNVNYYIYRVETITNYVKDVQDGVYYLYVLNSDNAIPVEFTGDKYTQKVVDLYPQLDRDNFDDNPPAAKSFAKRFPLGDVVTNDLKRSITRETVDKFVETFSIGKKIVGVSNAATSANLTLEEEHQLNGLNTYSTLNGGSGHYDGTYFGVRLFNDNSAPASAVWDGATADVTVSGGAVTVADIVEGGSGYIDGEQLYFDSSIIGGTPQANIQITSAGISTAEGNYVQVTGIGTTAGGYFRLTDTSNKKVVSIARTTGDPVVVENQYLINLGPAVTISQTAHDTISGISTFTAQSGPHGLLAGNSFDILDSTNNNLGHFVVNSATSPTIFTAKTGSSLGGARFVLKHGLSANNASAGETGENLGVRGLAPFANDTLLLNEVLTTQDQFKVTLPGGTTAGITDRFPLGSYIQIGNEIMRVKSSALTGTNSDEIQVIRGSMGTITESHANGSLIKKIELKPIELRRPSILRASGHTFEYLGYGPGNYSTGLPQVQVKTLTEEEEFLSQAQETACGTVLYTGMDSDGDFYIGNTKYSSQSGEQTTFDVPTPTITGENPNRLSVVFDEIIVKERILVEGGNSGQILSQFDGPVTFNADVRMNQQLVLNNSLRVTGTVDFRNLTDAQDCGDANASLRVLGGVAIGKRLFTCDTIRSGGGLIVAGISTFNTGIVPDTDEGAYIGTAARPWAAAHIGEIEIANGQGSNDDNTIKTATGNLILDSNAGTVDINDQLTVSGITTFESTQQNTIGDVNTGAVQVDGGVGIAKNLTVGGNFDVDGNTTLDATTIDGALTLNGNLNAGSNTITAATFSGQATDADQVKTVRTSTNANHFITFVDSNNATATNESVYTDGGLYYNPNSNNLFVANDIYAFVSDDRLKTNKVGITNALDKVNSLNGFTYTLNETAAGYGYDTSIRHAGVSAQEVEKVLPEVIGESAIGDDYITVKYDKLVPLLIEAIKELSAKVSDLEDRLNG